MQVPNSPIAPECVLELVLHVEQPYSDRARQKHNWEVHEQERSDADEPDQAGKAFPVRQQQPPES